MSEDIKYSIKCTIEGDAEKLEQPGQKLVGKFFFLFFFFFFTTLVISSQANQVGVANLRYRITYIETSSPLRSRTDRSSNGVNNCSDGSSTCSSTCSTVKVIIGVIIFIIIIYQHKHFFLIKIFSSFCFSSSSSSSSCCCWWCYSTNSSNSSRRGSRNGHYLS